MALVTCKRGSHLETADGFLRRHFLGPARNGIAKPSPNLKFRVVAHPAYCFTEAAAPTTHSEIGGFAGQFTAANSEYVSIASNASLQAGDVYLDILTSVYFDSLPAAGAQMGILGKWVAGDLEYVLLVDNTGGVITFQFLVRNVADDTTTTATATTFGAPSATTWYFLHVYHDPVANVIGISVNNGAADTAATAGGVRAGTAAFVIGRHTAGNYLNGRVGSTVIRKGSLFSAAEATWIYNTNKARLYGELAASYKTNLISWWDLQEMSGTRNDSHGTNHLTDVNTVTRALGPNAANAVVGTWKDLSGQGNHAVQATAGNKPLLSIAPDGKYSVRFDGVNDYLKATGALLDVGAAPVTVVGAFRPEALNTVPCVLAIGNTWDALRDYGFLFLSTGEIYGSNKNNDRSTAAGAVVGGTRYIITWGFTGAALSATNPTFYKDGVSQASTQGAGVGSPNIDPVKLILGNSTAAVLNQPYDGGINEVTIYKVLISTAQRQRLERYLGRAWGVTVP